MSNLESESKLTGEIINLISRQIAEGRVEEVRLKINSNIDSITSQLLFDADKRGYDVKRVADIDDNLISKYYLVITKRKQ